MPSKDPIKLKAARDRYRQQHKDAINERKRMRYEANADQHRARTAAFRQANREQVNQYNAQWSAGYRSRLRAEFIAEYGGCCTCCGETEPLFLQLDHIFNDGAEHRKTMKTGARLLAHLKQQGWPKDRYRLLCANCNFGRMLNNGICPHEDKR